LRIKHDFGGVKAPDLKYEALRGKVSVLIGTPTLDNKCSMDYTTSLLQSCIRLHELDIPFFFSKTLNSCFVDLSRNLIATQFMSSKCTHLWQIDSDMSWNPEAPLDMLLKQKEFIAGIGRKKTDETQFAGVNYTDENGTIKGELGETEEDTLIKMKYIGGAFTILTRSVFEKLQTTYPNLKSDGAGKGGYSYWQCEYNPSAWHTEDYVFSSLCEGAGVDVWCYPNIDMGHQGHKNYEGNWFKHLKKQRLPEIKVQYANT